MLVLLQVHLHSSERFNVTKQTCGENVMVITSIKISVSVNQSPICGSSAGSGGGPVVSMIYNETWPRVSHAFYELKKYS